MKEFKIIEVKEITTKEGKKFAAYKTVAKNGKKMDVRFVQACETKPKEPCIITVADGNANVDTSRQYPILWVKEVEEIKPLGEMKDNIDDFFD